MGPVSVNGVLAKDNRKFAKINVAATSGLDAYLQLLLYLVTEITYEAGKCGKWGTKDTIDEKN